METNPRDYGERCRFDAFCKTVLKHEAIDYIREMKRRASRETSLERLPQTAMDKLCSADDYPSDSYVFSYCGYDLPISNERVADAFASLPEQEQSILILRLVLDLTDSEIGEALGLSRSAVQRRRLVNSNLDAGFVIQNGVKILNKRQRFEQFWISCRRFKRRTLRKVSRKWSD